MQKGEKKRLKATSLWGQQVGQKMSNGILQPLVFHHLFISTPISLIAVPIRSIRPRRIKFTDKIIRTESQIRSRKWGSRPDVTATPTRPIAGVCTKSTHTTKPTSNFTEPRPNLKGRSLILVYLQRNMPMSSNAHTSRTRTERKIAIAGIMLGTRAVWQPGRVDESRSPNQKAQQQEPEQSRQDERRQRNSSCPAGFCFALHDRAKKRPGPRLLLASHISPGTRTRDRARRWYTRCNKFAMDDVEGGTRLSGDALSGRVDASKNRIPKWKLYQGAVLLGRTGGMRLRSQAKKRDGG